MTANSSARPLPRQRVSLAVFRRISDAEPSTDPQPKNCIANLASCSDQNYDVYDSNRLDTVIRPMLCREHQDLSDDALGACKTRIPMDFDPNGLSGGPVFALTLRYQEFILKFAGIINRASNSIIHFIKARNVQRLLDLPANE